MNIHDFVSKVGYRFCNTGGIDLSIYEPALQVYNKFSELCFEQIESEVDFFFVADLLEQFCRDLDHELSYIALDYGVNLLLMQFFYITIIHYRDFRVGNFFLSRIDKTYLYSESYENFIYFWDLQLPQILKQI